MNMKAERGLASKDAHVHLARAAQRWSLYCTPNGNAKMLRSSIDPAAASSGDWSWRVNPPPPLGPKGKLPLAKEFVCWNCRRRSPSDCVFLPEGLLCCLVQMPLDMGLRVFVDGCSGMPQRSAKAQTAATNSRLVYHGELKHAPCTAARCRQLRSAEDASWRIARSTSHVVVKLSSSWG